MLALGIETSCDETAVAIVNDGRSIVAERVLSQLAEHAPYGGVVPEVAARAHLLALARLIRECLGSAAVDLDAFDVIGATTGPGLIGGVMVGAMMAKSIACVRRKPFVAVNHLEAHALTPRLTDNVAFPYLLLLVSGGHTQLLVAEGIGRYRQLGTTIDDAAGEAFDKGAKLLGLDYPGGPAIERAANGGDPARFSMPRPMSGREDCQFSFSGLKTALRQTLMRLPSPLTAQQVSDLAASYQAAIADCLADRTEKAIRRFREGWLVDEKLAGGALVVAGGVAANRMIGQRLKGLADKHGLRFVAPPPRLCTDNGAMIAWAALERFRLGLVDRLDTATRPRWPLEALLNSDSG